MRKALHLAPDGDIDVLDERRILTELELHRAVASHPEVLPHDDLGLGPLVALGSEVQTDAGPLDLLLADAHGRLAICEFKKGSENSDVRKVVAQLLDYGASLWQRSFDVVERLCQKAQPGFDASLSDQVERLLGDLTVDDGPSVDQLVAPGFDRESFESGVRKTLDEGSFVFLYVVRDLDTRTKRIMTFLAEGARMAFFGVEVDHFRANGGSSLLVPRVSFVPSWISAQTAAARDPDADTVIGLMSALADELDVPSEQTATGRRYRGPGKAYIGVYRSSRGIEFGLKPLRDAGHEALANRLMRELETVLGRPFQGAGEYPSFRCARVLQDWPRWRDLIVRPFLVGDRTTERERKGMSAVED